MSYSFCPRAPVFPSIQARIGHDCEDPLQRPVVALLQGHGVSEDSGFCALVRRLSCAERAEHLTVRVRHGGAHSSRGLFLLICMVFAREPVKGRTEGWVEVEGVSPGACMLALCHSHTTWTGYLESQGRRDGHRGRSKGFWGFSRKVRKNGEWRRGKNSYSVNFPYFFLKL